MADEICHVEIAAKDMAAARDLYRDVFGWEFPLFSEQHALFRAGEGVGGGIWPVTNGLPDGPIRIYIHVEDIPAALAKVAQAGGKPERDKTQLPEDYGFMAQVRDPSGNLIGLWSKK